jgi:hypothetical protein
MAEEMKFAIILRRGRRAGILLSVWSFLDVFVRVRLGRRHLKT